MVNFVAIDLEINSQYKVLQKMSADGAHYFYSPAMKHSIPSSQIKATLPWHKQYDSILLIHLH